MAEDSARNDADDDELLDDEDEETEGLEKIEVHVHVHRGADAEKGGAPRRKRRPKPPVLTGDLYDWKGHYDLVCKRPPPGPKEGASATTTCHSCGSSVGYFARSCSRCQAPQPRGGIAKVVAILGLGSVIGIFALCAHFLGSSTTEYRALEPLGEWTTEDSPYVIEVPARSSLYDEDPSLLNGRPRSGERTVR